MIAMTVKRSPLHLAEAAEAPRSPVGERRDECGRVDDSIPESQSTAQRGTETGWMRKQANSAIQLMHLDPQCRKRKPSS
jgi:hypothetical protein